MLTKRPSTIWEGNDNDLLDWLPEFSLRREVKTIIDVTAGRKRFYKNNKYSNIVKCFDLVPQCKDVVKADFRCLPIKSNSCEVIIFDPPHISETGKNSLISHKCGFGDSGEENISNLFEPSLKEFKRILVDDGVILAKVADQVHRNSFQIQHVDFINECRKQNLRVCTIFLKIRKNSIMGLWKQVLHPRSFNCYWIVVRKGKC